MGDLVVELEQDLGVGPHPELLDAGELAVGESRAVQVGVPQGGERGAQHDEVGQPGRRAPEPEPVASVRLRESEVSGASCTTVPDGSR